MAVAILQHGAETVSVNLEHVVQLNYPRVVQFLLNIILSNGVSAKRNEKLLVSNHYGGATNYTNVKVLYIQIVQD